MKILIIDDDFREVVFIKDLVKDRCGHQALIAYNGEEGLQKAKDEIPDLIILDLMMPGMDGFEVCEEIRKDSTINKTPILMITISRKSAHLKRGFDVGANDFLRKPYDLLELEVRIKALLKHNLKPPFPQQQEICNIYINCQPERKIDIEGHGTFICRDHSEKSLEINPDVYERHALNPFNLKKWRFYTKETGKDIFQKIFNEHPRILSAYSQASERVNNTDQLKLSFESSIDFYKVPVEYMFDDTKLNDYVILHHPFSRFIRGVRIKNIPLSQSYLNKLWEKKQKLKILLIASNTEPSLQYVDTEILSLEETLHECLNSKGILHEIEYIPTEEATFDLVKKKLKNCPYHILHYAGHGKYKASSPEKSFLQFWSRKNRQGDIKRLDISALNLLLRNSNLRFVYLSCCQGSETAGSSMLLDDDFPGLAYGIAQAGIPSVLGFRH